MEILKLNAVAGFFFILKLPILRMYVDLEKITTYVIASVHSWIYL
jgi:hypothetical protein